MRYVGWRIGAGVKYLKFLLDGCRLKTMPCPRLAMDCKRYRGLAIVAVGLALLTLEGCSTTPGGVRDSAPVRPVDVSQVPDAVPRVEPKSRYGNPTSYVVHGKRYHTLPSSAGYRERGIASWYGTKFHGRRTSSGEPYDMYQMTAAHRSLPLPTFARITNLRNGRSVVVKINDRGPFHENRLIDLSYAAAARLGVLQRGTGLVEVAAIDPRGGEPEIREAARPPATQAPAPAAAAALAPAAGTNKDTDTSLFLQVGAFSDRNNAERLRRTLEASDLGDIHITEFQIGAKPLFRVRIGPLASVQDADRMSEALQNQGLPTPRVVID